MEQMKNNIKRVILKDEIATFYQHLFTYYPKAMHIILHSGRGTTKSTFFSIWNLWRLLRTPHADGMVIAYEYDSIPDKVFSDYKFAADVLQIPKQQIEFYSTKNGETWIKIYNKWGVNKIWFLHGKKGSEGFKGLRPTLNNGVRNRWLYVRFYELTNFISWNSRELNNACATFLRASYGDLIWPKIDVFCEQNNIKIESRTEKWVSKQDWFLDRFWDFKTHEFCFEYEFNTPAGTETSGGWVLDWLHDKREQLNVWYQFNNYLDMTKYEQYKFLGGDAIVEMNEMKLRDPINYNHIYLGKMPYEGSICFPNLDRRIHFGKHENFDPDVLVIGVDVGRNDPTVVTLNGFEYKGKDLRIALGMHRWSHCNRKMQYIKDGVYLPYHSWDINQYANMILEFCDMVHEEFPHTMIYFQMDREGAGKDFYDACFRFKDPSFLFVNRLWKKEKPTKRVDAFWTALTVPGILKIYDPVLFTAYRNQVWDKKIEKETGERKRLDDPSKPALDMDSQDSCEYGWLPEFFDMVIDRIRKHKGKFNGMFSLKKNIKYL